MPTKKTKKSTQAPAPAVKSTPKAVVKVVEVQKKKAPKKPVSPHWSSLLMRMPPKTKINPTDGIEIDPHTNASFAVNSAVDKFRCTFDRKRCVTTSEVTKQSLDAGHLEPVGRFFYTSPGPRVEQAPGNKPGDIAYDSRGNMASLDGFDFVFKNVSKAYVRLTATAARTLSQKPDMIHLRTAIADILLAPGQTHRASSRPGPEGAFYWSTLPTFQEIFHCMDILCEIPDAAPQDQSIIVNTRVSSDGKEDLMSMQRAWDPNAEIVVMEVQARYTVQQTSATPIFKEDSAFKVVFSADLDLPYAISDAPILRNGQLVDAKVVPNFTECNYDLSDEGWAGLGIAYFDDVESGDTVAYIAKMKAVAPTKRPGKKERLPRPKPRTQRENADAYPAFRKAAMEDPSYTISMPTSSGYWYDADGYDAGAGHSNYRWSEKYQSFVLWDFARQKPVFIEYGWGTPNYYFDWSAVTPQSGSLMAHKVPTKIQTSRRIVLGQHLVKSSSLTDPKINWTMVIAVATAIIKAGIDIAEVFRSNGRSQIPQE
jgi:hypothetical protein